MNSITNLFEAVVITVALLLVVAVAGNFIR